MENMSYCLFWCVFILKKVFFFSNLSSNSFREVKSCTPLKYCSTTPEYARRGSTILLFFFHLTFIFSLFFVSARSRSSQTVFTKCNMLAEEQWKSPTCCRLSKLTPRKSCVENHQTIKRLHFTHAGTTTNLLFLFCWQLNPRHTSPRDFSYFSTVVL